MTATDWRDRALCREVDPELFHPVGQSSPALLQIEEAKTVCGNCPVRIACLAAALDIEGGARPEYRHGVWGGLTGRERHDLYKRRARQRAAERARQAVTAA
jgi:WhiB family redox-sensing transcriptional regulator